MDSRARHKVKREPQHSSRSRSPLRKSRYTTEDAGRMRESSRETRSHSHHDTKGELSLKRSEHNNSRSQMRSRTSDRDKQTKIDRHRRPSGSKTTSKDNSNIQSEDGSCSIAVDYNHGNLKDGHVRIPHVATRGATKALAIDPHKQNAIENIENDEEVLMRKQKNVDYMKCTDAYEQYVTLLPKDKRQGRDPRTPDKFVKVSRRAWDGQIKHWKLRIHQYVTEKLGVQSTKAAKADSDGAEDD